MSNVKPKRALVLPLAALSILLPALAACGGSDGSSSSGSTAAAAGGGTAGKGTDRYVKFAQCMRQNGVPDWPDPIDGDKFLMPKGKIDPKSPSFKNASAKCESVRPPEWKAPSKLDPAVQAQALKYAKCMRQNGVSDFPDPQGGKLDIGNADSDSPQFKAADQKCQSLRPAGGGG
ncbi:hypothetical protein J4573_02945 [Actinomadura barringtoniae]|uniref:Lipoprotein n=1 Tax=Actinomadura barringtoniae TaxID=1427535 RepID=A0A939T0R0_9ACTN|nr:hypothetical protein [Actinomadura barringtoniae]MBO2446031.1 hypothetical protein [Actinomadura barringtoniae]